METQSIKISDSGLKVNTTTKIETTTMTRIVGAGEVPIKHTMDLDKIAPEYHELFIQMFLNSYQ